MKKYQIHLHCTEDAGDKKSNELHPSIYIKPLIFMWLHCMWTAFKYTNFRREKCSLSRHSAWQYGAQNKWNLFWYVPAICSTVIPQIKHILSGVTGATDLRSTKRYSSCWEALTSHSSSFLWATSLRKLIWDSQNFPRGSSSLKDYTPRSYEEPILKAQVNSTALLQSKVNKHILFVFESGLHTRLSSPAHVCWTIWRKTRHLFQDKRIFPADIRY